MKYEKIIIDIASDYIYNNDLKNYLKDIKFINNSEQKVPYIAGYDSNNKIILFNWWYYEKTIYIVVLIDAYKYYFGKLHFRELQK